MKRCFILSLALLACLAGCAAYRQLKPKQELSSQEQGYLELKMKPQKDFSLKKGKAYFIAFPPPQQEHFYLILSLPDKTKFKSFLTASLAKKKTPGEKIADETPYPDTVSVYPVGKSQTPYFWIVEKLGQDMTLKITYRYAPQWRFKFETHHARFTETLERNRVVRDVYNSIKPGYSWQAFNFTTAIDTVKEHTSNIENVHEELLAIESIFPPGVVNSSDEAYLNYKKLRADLEDELAFQKAYRATLEFFLAESRTAGNPREFLSRLEEFIGYFEKKDALLPNVLQEAQTVIQGRLRELTPFYDELMGEKRDAEPLDTALFRLGAFGRLPALFAAAGIKQEEAFAAMWKFVDAFAKGASALADGRMNLAEVGRMIKAGPAMPADDFFPPMVNKVEAIRAGLPGPIDNSYGGYASFMCASRLNRELENFGREVEQRLAQCRAAASLVPTLNEMKGRGAWREMIMLVRQNAHITFLPEKYRELDKMSVEKQSAAVRASLDGCRWREAEDGLRSLHGDENFIDMAAIAGIKHLAVLDLEDSLYTRIERATRAAVMKFAEERAGEVENVDSLYADSVFYPVHDVTFSSGGKKELYQRKTQLVADLQAMKENEFPARAIKLLFEQFVKNPDDNGVLKARAIVTHGRYYKGKDKDTRARIAECDPLTPKLIVKPTEYRRIYVLPVSNNRRGKNKYVLRLNVKIPTEAMFPVYDVNIKLPKEVAQNATQTQWYDEISINKNLIKNEGRFSITAPTAANEYECQVTPVQMNKDKDNIFEVTFTHDAFKVLMVSVMVQKPIIKKN